MLPTLGTVSATGAFRISRSFDGIGGMARTPADLASLIEIILLPRARRSIWGGGYESVMNGSWDGMKVGVVESTWGGGKPDKWDSAPVVSCLQPFSTGGGTSLILGPQKAKYESLVEVMRTGGANILYPASAPESDTLKCNGIGLKEVACKQCLPNAASKFDNYSPRI